MHEYMVFVGVEVQADVRELVQQAEPEVVDPIVAERQANHGAGVA